MKKCQKTAGPQGGEDFLTHTVYLCTCV